MWQVPKESWFSPKIEIKHSRVHGKGSFAKKSIVKGEVIEIWGEFWHGKQTTEYVSDKKRADNARKRGKVVMQWDKNLYSIENKASDQGYFINHSCDSNLWFDDPFTISARRAIKAGEELTLDYALFERDDYVSAWSCNCKFLNCRKVISGRDWQKGDVQKMYQGHFSPLINRKIVKLHGSKSH